MGVGVYTSSYAGLGLLDLGIASVLRLESRYFGITVQRVFFSTLRSGGRRNFFVEPFFQHCFCCRSGTKSPRAALCAGSSLFRKSHDQDDIARHVRNMAVAYPTRACVAVCRNLSCVPLCAVGLAGIV